MKSSSLVIAAFASASAPYVQAAPAALPSGAGGNLLAMTGALLLVVTLVFAAGWVVKRFMHGRLSGKTGESIKVVDQLMVGTRERLVVVEFGHKKILLGMVPGRISRLDAIDVDSSSDFRSALQESEDSQ